MRQFRPGVRWIKLHHCAALILFVLAPFSARNAQTPAGTDGSSSASLPNSVPEFRTEKVPVAGGAELITIFARSGPAAEAGGAELPLVTVLRDTLGDEKPENDQLRYLWMLTYTKPSAGQTVASFVPFLYSRVGNKVDAGTGPPPPVADLRRSNKAFWNTVFWTVFKKILLSQASVGKASVLQYHQNSDDYRRSAIARALSVLSLYESVNGEKLLSDSEMKDIEARLWLTDKQFGWHMRDENLERVYDKELALTRDLRGHNWELLRQYSEAQGLYFEPMVMADGVARHAIVWAAAEDLAANRGRKYDSRFLNIRNPWTDSKLLKWKGYSQVRWYDADERVVEEGTPGAHAKTLIPLAIYGLDYPKIPTLLVDFRDTDNPKRREMSRRVLNDITGNLLSISKFSSVPYFVGRYVYDYVTDKRGIDINQVSRVRAYAQLKTLLSLDASLDDGFRNEISHRLERVSLNPMENDLEVEAKLAQKQYENLLAWAKRPDGLPAKLDRERREEMVKLAHGKKDRIMYSIAHVLTLGQYTHREKATSELVAAMDTNRQLHFHERFLREVAFKSARPEVDSDVTAVKNSLLFVSQHGEGAEEKTTRALAKIFSITDDEEMRSLCVTSLYRINNSSAKKQLLAIYDNSKLPARWRDMSAHYLKQALSEGQQMTVRDAETVAGIGAN